MRPPRLPFLERVAADARWVGCPRARAAAAPPTDVQRPADIPAPAPPGAGAPQAIVELPLPWPAALPREVRDLAVAPTGAPEAPSAAGRGTTPAGAAAHPPAAADAASGTTAARPPAGLVAPPSAAEHGLSAVAGGPGPVQGPAPASAPRAPAPPPAALPEFTRFEARSQTRGAGHLEPVEGESPKPSATISSVPAAATGTTGATEDRRPRVLHASPGLSIHGTDDRRPARSAPNDGEKRMAKAIDGFRASPVPDRATLHLGRQAAASAGEPAAGPRVVIGRIDVVLQPAAAPPPPTAALPREAEPARRYERRW